MKKIMSYLSVLALILTGIIGQNAVVHAAQVTPNFNTLIADDHEEDSEELEEELEEIEEEVEELEDELESSENEREKSNIRERLQRLKQKREDLREKRTKMLDRIDNKKERILDRPNKPSVNENLREATKEKRQNAREHREEFKKGISRERFAIQIMWGNIFEIRERRNSQATRGLFASTNFIAQDSVEVETESETNVDAESGENGTEVETTSETETSVETQNADEENEDTEDENDTDENDDIEDENDTDENDDIEDEDESEEEDDTDENDDSEDEDESEEEDDDDDENDDDLETVLEELADTITEDSNNNDRPDSQNFDGSLTLNNAVFTEVGPLLFENNDKITAETQTNIEWTSNAGPHIDGIAAVVVMKNKDDATMNIELSNEVNATLSYQDLKENNGKMMYEFSNGLGAMVRIHKIRPGMKPYVKQENISKVVTKLRNRKSEDALGRVFQFIPNEEREAFQDDILELGNDDLNDLFEDMELLGEAEVEATLEHLEHFPKNQRAKLLKRKVQVLKAAKIMRKIKANANEGEADIEDIVAEIENFTFPDNTGEEVSTKIAELLEKINNGTITRSELQTAKRRISQLKREATNEKFEKGIISFKDNDDSNWFAKYVERMAKKNIVQGYKDKNGELTGEYGPSNNVTVAEALKIALLVVHSDIEEAGDPASVKAQDHWARVYFKLAEELSLDIVQSTAIDPNREITRGEVVRLLLEILDVEIPSVTATGFADVAATHEHADFIAYAKAEGIIQGDSETGNFRPNDGLNRAELAKIVDLVISIVASIEAEQNIEAL